MELVLVNLEGDLADPHLLGLLHANEPELEVELEIVPEIDDAWFDTEISETADDPPSRHGILREALRFLVRRRRDER